MSSSDRIDSRFLRAIAQPGAVIELRILGTDRGTVSGYFDPDHHDALKNEAERWNGAVPGIYVTLNPARNDLLARAANRSVPFARSTTGNSDIICRRFLPLDFDPRRPAGVCSTDEEHRMALDRADKTREWLRSQGWTDPIFADSGSGAHLIYGIELDNSERSTELIRAVTMVVHERFSDDAVVVDTTTSNAGRIWRLYGTLNAKGDGTTARPHRISRIIDFPAACDE